MEAWWQGLSVLNKSFAVAAVFFSVLFVWQLIGMFLGFDADGHGEVGHAGMDHADSHAGHHGGGEIAFTLVSVRSAIAFGMLFSWAGTLYLMEGTHPVLVLFYSFLWGMGAMVAVSYLVYRLVRMEERGNVSIWSAMGEDGVVYMNFPPGGAGKIRVKVGGVVSCVDARSVNGEPLLAGTRVRVVGVVDERILEVKALDSQEGD